MGKPVGFPPDKMIMNPINNLPFVESIFQEGKKDEYDGYYDTVKADDDVIIEHEETGKKHSVFPFVIGGLVLIALIVIAIIISSCLA